MKKSSSINHFIFLTSYILIHLSLLTIFWIPISKVNIEICLFLYFINMWAVTAGYHRYFSHKSFSTSRIFQFILAWLAQSATQTGILWWANHHRLHHSYSDQPLDPHSPTHHGFFYSHMGWIFDRDNSTFKGKAYSRVNDLIKFPELVWLDKYHFLPTVVMGISIFIFWGWSGFITGFLFSRILVWHATYTINSLAHRYGSKRYPTLDESRNNFWLALLTLGEGWHNNHHHYASSAKQGFFWWEIDITYYTLRLLYWLNIIWDLKIPPKEKIIVNN